MRFLPLLSFIIISTGATAQCVTYKLTSRGDTINCTDKQNLKQGKWKIEVPPLRGERGFIEEGSYTNNRKEGVWRRFSQMGDLLAVENYKWGNKNGMNRYFTINGLEREESWMAVNPNKAYDTIDVQDIINPNKYEKVIVKVEGASLRHGTWRFYDPLTGQLVKTENWYLDQFKDPANPTPTNGYTTMNRKTPDSLSVAKQDTSTKKVKPKEVLDFEKKNAGKKKVAVRDGRTGG